MKTKLILTVLLFGAAAFSGFSQTAVQSGTKFGKWEDSIRCLQNISLLAQYAKQQDYNTASDFWDLAYDECPSSHTSIYTYGPKIVAWQLTNAKDAASKAKLFDKLMGVYDNRIKYFGNSARYGKPYILGRKAIDYVQYVDSSKDPQKEKAYEWLKEALQLGGKAKEADVFQQ